MTDRKIIAVAGATGAQGGGLVRAILNDPTGGFAVRALTRDVNTDKAKELARLGAEVVKADLDDPASIERAFKGAYGAYCVTFFWDHFSPERELAEAASHGQRGEARRAEARGLVDAGRHAQWVPLDDERMPTLMGRFKVPHFDAKGEAEQDCSPTWPCRRRFC